MTKKSKIAKNQLFEVEEAKVLTPLEVVDMPATKRKLTPTAIIESLERTVGSSYADQLAANYREAILNEDYETLLAYDKLLLNKLLEVEKQELQVRAGAGITITFTPGSVPGFDEENS